MYNKKYSFLILSLIFLFAILPLVLAVKPITSIQTDSGYIVEVTEKSAIRLGEDHEFEVHVFNISNGLPITSGISCHMHLYFEDGNHVYEGIDTTVAHNFDYAFDLDGGNFTKRGEYQAKFQCNSSTLGGGQELYFIVNGFGEELTTAHSITFNASMLFMMILFLLALVGIFSIENPLGKFACYWVVHILFVIGTFSMWQYNNGYAMSFVGLAMVWKWLFYVAIFSMLPLMIMSIAGMIIYFATEKKVMNLIDHGMSEQEARRRVK